MPDTAKCQDKTVDSLRLNLEETVGEDRVDLLFKLATKYGDEDYETGLVYARQGFALAKEMSDSLRIVKLGRAHAQLLRRLGKIDSAIYLLSDLLPVAKRNNFNEELVKILNSFGTANLLISKYDTALECFFEGLWLSEKKNDNFFTSVFLNNIGLTYYQLGDYGKALAYYTRSVQLKTDRNDFGLDLALTNISLCHIFLKNYTMAQNFLDSALRICGKNCSKSELIIAYHGQGLISFFKNDFDAAERKFKESYQLCQEMKDDRYALDNLGYLLQIYSQQRQFVNAEKCIKLVEVLIRDNVPYYTELSIAYSQIVTFYRQTSNSERMALFQNKYIALRDSVFNSELTINLMNVEGDRLIREHAERIDAQNEILALNSEMIQVQKFLNFFIGIVTLLLVAFIIVLFRSNRQKQKINLLLDKKVQERTQQLELNRDLLQRACDDRDNIIRKASMDINNSVATLKGLCALGLKDVEDQQALLYISKMNTTSDSFSEIVNRLRVHRDPSVDHGKLAHDIQVL